MSRCVPVGHAPGNVRSDRDHTPMGAVSSALNGPSQRPGYVGTNACANTRRLFEEDLTTI
jgi:hypothetical protein